MPTQSLLLAFLQCAGFVLVPSHRRELDGRIVGAWYSGGPGEKPRPITDHEIAARFLGGAPYGGRFRRTWYWTVNGLELQFNPSFEHWHFYGVRYRNDCRDCGAIRWDPISRPPGPSRCRTCQLAQSQTPICPETELRCSSAYGRDRCRCDTCRAWKLTNTRARRARKLSGDQPDISCKDKDYRAGEEQPNHSISGWSPTSAPEGWAWGAEEWTWLPASVRDCLIRYEAAAVMEGEQKSLASSSWRGIMQHGPDSRRSPSDSPPGAMRRAPVYPMAAAA